MTNVKLTTKGPSPTDQIEKKSQLIFGSKLPVSDAQFVWYGEKYPNLDGHIEFLGENGSTTIMLYFQLKGSEQDITYYDCEIPFLRYCYQSFNPIFLVFVNIPQEKIYWEHITQTYITSTLGIKDLVTFNQKTKRIIFSKEKVIDNNAKILEEVCRKYYQNKEEVGEYIQKAANKGMYISGQEPMISGINEAISLNKQESAKTLQQVSPKKKEIDKNIFDCLKKKFAALINDIPNKLMFYYAFVYMLKPFYLDQRGEKKRRKLIDLMQITASQEHFIRESLINANFLGRVGDLIFVVKKEEAISIINNYIDTGQLNFEKITGLFS